MVKTNWSHLSGRIRRFFGWKFTSEEACFRLYFSRASDSIGANTTKVFIEEYAREVVKAFDEYAKCKDGYDVTVRGNARAHLELYLNESSRQREIGKLFSVVKERYTELVEACFIAHHFKGDAIPEDPLDERLFGNLQLRKDLIYVAAFLKRVYPENSLQGL